MCLQRAGRCCATCGRRAGKRSSGSRPQTWRSGPARGAAARAACWTRWRRPRPRRKRPTAGEVNALQSACSRGAMPPPQGSRRTTQDLQRCTSVKKRTRAHAEAVAQHKASALQPDLHAAAHLTASEAVPSIHPGPTPYNQHRHGCLEAGRKISPVHCCCSGRCEPVRKAAAADWRIAAGSQSRRRVGGHGHTATRDGEARRGDPRTAHSISFVLLRSMTVFCLKRLLRTDAAVRARRERSLLWAVALTRLYESSKTPLYNMFFSLRIPVLPVCLSSQAFMLSN